MPTSSASKSLPQRNWSLILIFKKSAVRRNTPFRSESGAFHFSPKNTQLIMRHAESPVFSSGQSASVATSKVF